MSSTLIPFNTSLARCARFGSVGVNCYDPYLLHSDGRSFLQYIIPPFDTSAKDSTYAEKLESARVLSPLVFLHDLYPIADCQLKVDKVVLEHYAQQGDDALKDGWMNAVYDSGYKRNTFTVEDYFNMVGVRGLFGETCNPISRVLLICFYLKRLDLLTNYVFVVAAQFYFIANQSFLEQRTDSKYTEFSEGKPQYMFMAFRSFDWRTNKRRMASLALDANMDNLTEHATNCSLPEFLYLVFMWLQDVMRRNNLVVDDKMEQDMRQFCFEKLLKNFVQALVCMRFREIIPENIQDAVPELTMSTIKFFSFPRFLMPAVDSARTHQRLLDRVPQFFAHLFFSPNRPILTCASTDTTREILWKVMLYMPRGILNSEMYRSFTRLQPNDPVLMPISLASKQSTYDVYMRQHGLDPGAVALRYTFFFHRDQACVYIPTMYQDPTEIPYDERSPHFMSEAAWTWCVNRGVSWSREYCIDKLKRVKDTFDRNLAIKRFSQTHGNCWILFFSYMFALGSEENACAAMAKEGYTLQDLRQGYDAFREQCSRCQLASNDIHHLSYSWDRCSTPQVPDDIQEPSMTIHYRWWMHFPASAILYAHRPWTDSWEERDTTVPLSTFLFSTQRMFSQKPVQRAIAAARKSKRRLNLLQRESAMELANHFAELANM